MRNLIIIAIGMGLTIETACVFLVFCAVPQQFEVGHAVLVFLAICAVGAVTTCAVAFKFG